MVPTTPASLDPVMHVTFEDLLPSLVKRTWEERVRLSQLALQVTDSEERETAVEANRNSSALAHECADLEDPLSWDAEGWEDAERPYPPGVR